MRVLLAGALCVPLIGCACPPSPQTTQKPCTSKSCLHRSAAVAPREVRSAGFKLNPATPAIRRSSPESAPPRRPVENPKAVVADAPAQSSDGSDPVLKKAKTAVASKLEDPASAQFVDMKRAMRTDAVGQSVDTICGHVQGKTASGEATGERAFLYLVKDDVAFVDYGTTDSVAADAYRNVCTKADLHRENFGQ